MLTIIIDQSALRREAKVLCFYFIRFFNPSVGKKTKKIDLYKITVQYSFMSLSLIFAPSSGFEELKLVVKTTKQSTNGQVVGIFAR